MSRFIRDFMAGSFGPRQAARMWGEPGAEDHEFLDPPMHDPAKSNQSWRTIPVEEQHRRELSFRRDLARTFMPGGRDHVTMETGHRIRPLADPQGHVWATIGHPNMDQWDTIRLHLGNAPEGHIHELARRLGQPEVMRSLREQMNGVPQSRPVYDEEPEGYL